MSDYRLYFIDGGGHFRQVVELDCRHDNHAVETAEEHRDGRPMELWRRDRLVKRFEASAEDQGGVHRAPGRPGGM